MGALNEHEDALRASLQAVYGIRLSQHDYGVLEIADLTAHLPPGCALWRAAGGPLAWADETHMLSAIDYGVRVLAWQNTQDGAKGRNQPKHQEPPAHAGETREAEARKLARAESWSRRNSRRD